MFRVFLFIVVLFHALGRITAQADIIFVDAIPSSSNYELLTEINNAKHAEFGTHKLVAIKCARSQGDPDRSYIIIGKFIDRDVEKTCEFDYIEPIDAVNFVRERSLNCSLVAKEQC